MQSCRPLGASSWAGKNASFLGFEIPGEPYTNLR
jgi:hypothetical protein